MQGEFFTKVKQNDDSSVPLARHIQVPQNIMGHPFYGPQVMLGLHNLMRDRGLVPRHLWGMTNNEEEIHWSTLREEAQCAESRVLQWSKPGQNYVVAVAFIDCTKNQKNKQFKHVLFKLKEKQVNEILFVTFNSLTYKAHYAKADLRVISKIRKHHRHIPLTNQICASNLIDNLRYTRFYVVPEQVTQAKKMELRRKLRVSPGNFPERPDTDPMCVLHGAKSGDFLKLKLPDPKAPVRYVVVRPTSTFSMNENRHTLSAAETKTRERMRFV